MNIDQLIEDFSKEFTKIKNDPSEIKEPLEILSLPMPKDYKSKYDELQCTTGRKFGKLLQEFNKRLIDAAI